MLRSSDSFRWPRSNYFVNFDTAHCVRRAATHFRSPTWNDLASRDDTFAIESIAVERTCPTCHCGVAIEWFSSAAVAVAGPNYCRVDLAKVIVCDLSILNHFHKTEDIDFSTYLPHLTDSHRWASIQ